MSRAHFCRSRSGGTGSRARSPGLEAKPKHPAKPRKRSDRTPCFSSLVGMLAGVAVSSMPLPVLFVRYPQARIRARPSLAARFCRAASWPSRANLAAGEGRWCGCVFSRLATPLPSEAFSGACEACDCWRCRRRDRCSRRRPAWVVRRSLWRACGAQGCRPAPTRRRSPAGVAAPSIAFSRGMEPRGRLRLRLRFALRRSLGSATVADATEGEVSGPSAGELVPRIAATSGASAGPKTHTPAVVPLTAVERHRVGTPARMIPRWCSAAHRRPARGSLDCRSAARCRTAGFFLVDTRCGAGRGIDGPR